MKKALIYIMATIMLIIIPIALASDWTQYTPSPTTNDIIKIRITDNGKAFAITTSGVNYLLYNGTGWEEILSPNSSLISGYTYTDFDKSGDGNIYILYSNGTQRRIIKLDMTTQAYSTHGNTDGAGDFLICTYDENNKCYWIDKSGSNVELYQIVPSISLVSNLTVASGFTDLMPSNEKLMAYYTGLNDRIYEWGGVSWTIRWDLGAIVPQDSNHVYRSSSSRAICFFSSDIRWYNISTGKFNADTTYSSRCDGMIDANGQAYFVYLSAIREINWYSGTATINTNTVDFMEDIDYDATTDTAWAVGDGGIIYEYEGTPVPPSEEYNLNIWIEPNPTIYGQQVEFHAQATHTGGKASNITMYIYSDFNLTILKYTTTQNNIPSGTDLTIYEILESSPFWLTYPPNQTYYYYATAVTTDNTNATGSIIEEWIVTGGETENVTNYETESFYEEMPSGYETYSVTAQGEENAFASASKTSDNKQYIISFDSTTPTNIISSLRNTSLTDDGGTNPNTIRDLSVYTDTLYIGTNDELYIYGNATDSDAEELTYIDEEELIGNDGVIDVHAISDSKVWIGQDGTFLDDDDIFLYNLTDTSFTQQLNINPLQSLFYHQGYIIAHQGGNREVEIWDGTTATKESTIDITNTISVYSYTDIIDTFGSDNLYIIAGSNYIKKYDIANRSNPIELAKCHTPQEEEIVSIESIYENEVAIGTIDTSTGFTYIMVCDFGNNETYDLPETSYEAQLLESLLERLPYEIEKMDSNGKLHTAEKTHYGIYFYTKGEEELPINNPPAITQIIATDSTPCLEQVVQFQIIASDPDQESGLRYESSCTGGSYNNNEWITSNTFTCEYDTLGIKNINVWVKDDFEEIDSDSTSVNVTNCTAPQVLYFRVIDYDTGQEISGATISIEGFGTQITDANGNAQVSVGTYQEYTTTWTADGYDEKSFDFFPSSTRYTLWLDSLTDPETGETLTALIIITKNEGNDLISGSLVNVNNPITTENRYGITDANGQITFTKMFTGSKLIVSAINEEQGYVYTTTYISLSTNEQKTITITFGEDTSPLGEGILPPTNRGCIDTIPNVYLCGDLSGDNNRCDEDTDCLSGRCMVALTTEGRKCSMFNYNLCDEQGINRGNMCITKNSIIGGLKMMGNAILDYFLYVLILLFVIVVGLIIKKNLSHR